MDHEVQVGVTHLLTSYQYLGDTGKIERLAQLFAPDGVLELDGVPHVGVDAVLAFFRDTAGRFAAADFLPARHHLSSIYVEAQPDGSAKSYACFQFIGIHGLDHWGTYRDVAVPTEDGTGWRFAHRRVITEGFAPDSRLAPPPAT
ncbi:nuclear transport factor 2 family protein [Mycolicibacterium sp.]|uniref:nuclear transport factor 2 family protein n=1 Tax=Mycolicibacterium sp. TaxID=2320850 RepID=UPI001A287D67|nr:nuclear transport factor 2 family protein [Mycolicibacterium sp.]MBJ7337812.1 nuclear transport factor 2 family protein [Mycolicibacterium sp.]